MKFIKQIICREVSRIINMYVVDFSKKQELLWVLNSVEKGNIVITRADVIYKVFICIYYFAVIWI